LEEQKTKGKSQNRSRTTGSNHAISSDSRKPEQPAAIGPSVLATAGPQGEQEAADEDPEESDLESAVKLTRLRKKRRKVVGEDSDSAPADHRTTENELLRKAMKQNGPGQPDAQTRDIDEARAQLAKKKAESFKKKDCDELKKKLAKVVHLFSPEEFDMVHTASHGALSRLADRKIREEQEKEMKAQKAAVERASRKVASQVGRVVRVRKRSRKKTKKKVHVSEVLTQRRAHAVDKAEKRSSNLEKQEKKLGQLLARRRSTVRVPPNVRRENEARLEGVVIPAKGERRGRGVTRA